MNKNQLKMKKVQIGRITKNIIKSKWCKKIIFYLKWILDWVILKLKDLLLLLWAFLIVAVIYYFFTWIAYKNFTTEQISELIKNEINLTNYSTTKYLVDIKWYWEKDLIVIVSPNKENIQIDEFNQSNFNWKLYIFTEIQQNPLQKFIFTSKLYKKEFSFEFPFTSIEDLKNNWWEFSSNDAWEYQLYMRNSRLWEVNFIKDNSEFNSKYNIIIEWTQYRNHWLIYYDYFMISHDVNGYSINPLLPKDSFDVCVDIDKFINCANWVQNISRPILVNWKYKYYETTLIESNLRKIFELSDEIDGKISFLFHGNDSLTQEIMWNYDNIDYQYVKYTCHFNWNTIFCPTFWEKINDIEYENNNILPQIDW